MAIGVLGGCAKSRNVETSVPRTVNVAVESAEADRWWEAAQELLRRRGFRLDRVDRRAAVITTLPEVSQHWFEFWRRDVATATDYWQATLNPVRRWAEIRFTSASGEGESASAIWTDVAIVVHKERLTCPDRQFNCSAAAYQFFGESLPSTTGAIKVTVEEDRWLAEGRDAALETRLLQDLWGLNDQAAPAPS
jgi:hypothetical protein